MAALFAPDAISASTLRSLSVSSGNGLAEAARWLKKRAMRAAMPGEKIASPWPTATIGAGEVVAVHVLEDVSARPGAHRGEHGVVVLEHGHDEDRGGWVAGDDLASRLEPTAARHLQVHQDEVGRELADGTHSGLAVGRLPHDLDPRLGREQRADAFAEQRVVIGDNDAHDVIRHEASLRAGRSWSP